MFPKLRVRIVDFRYGKVFYQCDEVMPIDRAAKIVDAFINEVNGHEMTSEPEFSDYLSEDGCCYLVVCFL